MKKKKNENMDWLTFCYSIIKNIDIGHNRENRGTEHKEIEWLPSLFYLPNLDNFYPGYKEI